MSYPRGSEWSQWDLHVHTPASFVNKYGEGGGDPWSNFIDDLEALPPQFRAIGVNDYIFVDGYERILRAKASGRLGNIDLVLPVVELRLSHFGGSGSDLSRINLHVIFSDELDPGVIQSQFINGLRCEMSLLPGNAREGQWSSRATRESFEELGQLIRESSAVDQSEHNDCLLGFNNFNVSLDNVNGLLSNPIFDNKYLLATGKVEWAAQRWNQQSIAFKKTLINRPHFVFTAADTPANFQKARTNLRNDGVNDKLLDCSDAHYLSSAAEPNRIGNCLTWVNALPTFEGLMHAFHEYEDRVYVGDMPEKLATVDLHRNDYFERVAIRPLSAAQAGPTIDVEVPLNPGVVAIVGNKGKGKSALADILGLLSGSNRGSHFSFLTTSRFCEPKLNPAGQHEADLIWVSGHDQSARLDQPVGDGAIQKVRYLPQSYLESVCDNGPGGDDRFSAELGDVIFSHVPDSLRLEQSTLDDLISAQSSPTLRRLEMLRARQKQTIKKLLTVRRQIQGGEHRSLVALEAERVRELEAHASTKPVEVETQTLDEDAAADTEQRLDDLRLRIADLEARVETKRTEASHFATRLGRADVLGRELDNIENEFNAALTEITPIAAELEIEVDEIVTLTVRRDVVSRIGLDMQALKEAAEREISVAEEGSVAQQCAEARVLLEEMENELEAPQRRRQAYLSALSDWEAEGRRIVGSPTQADSLENVRHRLEAFDRLPGEFSALHETLLDQTGDVHAQLVELSSIYASLYAPVQDFIARHPLASERFDLSFDVNLVERNLKSVFFSLVGRQVSGSYSGTADGENRLDAHIASTDFDSKESVLGFVGQVADDLTHDNRAGRGRESVSLEGQLRKGASPEKVYELLYGLEYLEPDFWLRSEGAPISQLSPGQRGTLLLLFYLVVDKSQVPIILDQPEENLDNETVHDLLVPAINSARRRRQVIVVTHNPNLAVVGDADQVVVAQASQGSFSYLTGAIEDPEINERIVSILEGTWPAFRNRSNKYLPSRLRGITNGERPATEVT